MARGGGRGIQSIEVSGRILSALVKSFEPMMLKDLAEVANLAPAQCHAYLNSLRTVGLVNRDHDTGHYQLGPLAMRLGISWLKSSPVAATAIRELKRITEETGLTTAMVLWGEFGPTIVHISDGTETTALNLRQGSLFSTTGTASGRLFAAFGDPALIEPRVDIEFGQPGRERSLGWSVTREDFAADVRATQKKGYATAQGKPIPGINAVAVPIFSANGTLLMAVTMIGSEGSLSVEDGSDDIKRLQDGGETIMNALSGIKTDDATDGGNRSPHREGAV